MAASPEKLARQSQAGCRDSFAALVEQFKDRIFSFLLQLVGNAHDAEDLTQETFLKAYQNIHRFDPTYAFSTWLFTIAKRTAYSHFRSSRPTQELEDDAEIEWQDPAAALVQKDDNQSLWKLAKRLKPTQYEALWLIYGEGLSIAEAASVMRTNQLRVRVLMYRGRTQLAKWLRNSSTRSAELR